MCKRIGHTLACCPPHALAMIWSSKNLVDHLYELYLRTYVLYGSWNLVVDVITSSSLSSKRNIIDDTLIRASNTEMTVCMVRK